MHTFFRSAVLFTILLGAAGDAFAAPPAPPAEVASIEIVPGNVAVGKLPKVTGRIARTSAPVPLEPAMFNIVAVVTLPDKVTRSTTWKNETFEKGQRKDYPLALVYDTKQPGSYSVEYIVYTSDMSRRLATSSRTFTVGDAAPPPAGKTADVSIEVVPGTPAVGQLPKVTGRIARTNVPLPEDPALFTIIAVVKLPSNVTKSMTWKNESFEKGQAKDYPLSLAYDTSQHGPYRVEYIVYTSDMSRRLATSSRTFTIGDAAPPQAGKKETPPAAVKKEAPRQPTGVRNTAGIGIYGNALNPAGGGTLLLWPFEHVGLQASYTVGTFTTAEARMLVRFSPVWGVRPYIGVGYLNVTTTEDVIGVSTDFKDSSISGVAGVEVPLGRRWFGYIEVSGASIDLEEIVTNGGQTVKATVDYAPATIGVSIIYYFF